MIFGALLRGRFVTLLRPTAASLFLSLAELLVGLRVCAVLSMQLKRVFAVRVVIVSKYEMSVPRRNRGLDRSDGKRLESLDGLNGLSFSLQC